MAVNFPSSPSLNQIYTFGTKSWYWNGAGWAASGSQSLSTSATGVFLNPTDSPSSALYYINFASDSSGTQLIRTDTDLLWNPNTNNLILASGAGSVEAIIDGGVF